MSILERKHMPEPIRRMDVFTGAGRRRSLVSGGEGRDCCRELRRGRDGLWRCATPSSDATAAVHLVTTGQAGRSLTAGNVRAGSVAREEAPSRRAGRASGGPEVIDFAGNGGLGASFLAIWD